MSSTIEVQIVHAFTDGEAGGNPAGVVLDGAALTREQRQRVAASAGFSETAFPLPSDTADILLEFYTPTRSIAHCGHATVASFSLLAALGRLGDGTTILETVDGPRSIGIDDGLAFLEQVAPRETLLASNEIAEAAAALGVGTEQLTQGAAPRYSNNGNGVLLIEVPDRTALAALTPDMERVAALTRRFDAVCFYVFTRDAKPGRAASARMFGPAYGIPEEAATGMAAGPLAALLDGLEPGRSGLEIEQGHFMSPPSPSLIRVRFERRDGQLTSIHVGGKARVERSIQVALD